MSSYVRLWLDTAARNDENQERFSYGSELAQILTNTVKDLGLA